MKKLSQLTTLNLRSIRGWQFHRTYYKCSRREARFRSSNTEARNRASIFHRYVNGNGWAFVRGCVIPAYNIDEG